MVKLTMAASRRTSRTRPTREATVHRVDLPRSWKEWRRVCFRKEEGGAGGGLVLLVVMVLVMMLVVVWWVRNVRVGRDNSAWDGRCCNLCILDDCGGKIKASVAQLWRRKEARRRKGKTTGDDDDGEYKSLLWLPEGIWLCVLGVCVYENGMSKWECDGGRSSWWWVASSSCI